MDSHLTDWVDSIGDGCVRAPVAADRRLPGLSRSEGPSWRTTCGLGDANAAPSPVDGQMAGTDRVPGQAQRCVHAQ